MADDRTPSDPNEPGRPHQEVPVPDPHRGEPTPPPEEGLRPEADPDLVRPVEDEPDGPLPGLLHTASAKATEEATPGGDPEAEALLAQMGVEEEGIESGQILGLVAAVAASVVALVIVLIFLFYEPFLGATRSEAEDVALYPELEAVRTSAAAKLGTYARSDSTYTVPIQRAMGLVVADYRSAPRENQEAVAAQPTTSARWNTLMVTRGPGLAVSAPDPRVPLTPETPRTGEEVGVDQPYEADPDESVSRESLPDDN